MRSFAGRARANTRATWEIVKNLFSIEVLIANNDVAGKYADEIHASHFETATGITAAFQSPRSSRHSRNGTPYIKWTEPTGGRDTMRSVVSSTSSHPTSQSTAAWEWL
jgi:hypothetical protein